MSDRKYKMILAIMIAVIAVLTVCLHGLAQQPESPPAPGKEAINWAPAPIFSIFYQGTLYDDPEAWGGIRTVPKDAQLVGTLNEITDTPDRELECSLGEVGAEVYLWEEDGMTLLGYEVDYPYEKRANTIAISGNPNAEPEEGFIVVY